MNVLGVVPARGGSKRVPRKNILTLGGMPLIHHCLRAATQSGTIHRLVVSTEDLEIADRARDIGVEVLERPTELAQDDTPTLPVIEHAIAELDRKGFIADVILTIQPPYPFIVPDTFVRAVQALRDHPDIDSVTSVTKASFRYHPYNARRILADGTLSFMFPKEKEKCPNSQSAPPVFYFGNLYASRRTTILKKESLAGDRSYPVEVEAIEAFDIDDMFDVELAEWMMSRRSLHANE